MTEKNEVKATRKEEEKESMSNEKIAIKLAALMGRRCGEAATEFRKARSLKELEEDFIRESGINLGIYLAGLELLGSGPLDDELCEINEDIDKTLDFEKFMARASVSKNMRERMACDYPYRKKGDEE